MINTCPLGSKKVPCVNGIRGNRIAVTWYRWISWILCIQTINHPLLIKRIHGTPPFYICPRPYQARSQPMTEGVTCVITGIPRKITFDSIPATFSFSLIPIAIVWSFLQFCKALQWRPYKCTAVASQITTTRLFVCQFVVADTKENTKAGHN